MRDRELGVTATVFFDRETHGPMVAHEIEGEGLREITSDAVLYGPLVDEINIVSIYAIHVALYALQNPTDENVRQALKALGVSGDLDDWTDMETLLPLPVPPPPGWVASDA